MRPRKPFPIDAAERLQKLLESTKSIADFKRIQCAWLRAVMDLSIEQIARITGLSTNTVRCYHSRYMLEGESALIGVGRGGRRHQNLTIAEEEELLRGFMYQAEQGGILEVSEIKAVYERVVGHEVPKSTVYRMLARHGWRKIAPRSRHPKSDSSRQESFKKNSHIL